VCIDASAFACTYVHVCLPREKKTNGIAVPGQCHYIPKWQFPGGKTQVKNRYMRINITYL
jgi:hypothetical protein